MIWSDGYTASYYITIVDPKSWRDIGRMEIEGGGIDRTTTDLLESADLKMTELPDGGEAWIRVWLDAEQEGIDHVALFTGLTSAPSRELDGRRNNYTVECYSVLKPVNDILTERGAYVPTEVVAPYAAARLLRAGIAPVEVADAEELPQLTDAIIAEDGETNLTLADKVLSAIGWQKRIDGTGTIHVEPISNDIVQTFDADLNDVIELAITDEQDWYACPNILRVISGDMTAVASDTDPESPLSTASRGREIWAEESSPSLGTNESIGAYANRRLKELQSPARTVSYARRYDPDVRPGDVIRINHPEIGIDGIFRVQTQSLELSYACRTSETAMAV